MKKALLVVTLAVCALFYLREGTHTWLFYGDALGYYLYLPATFIYHNHKSLEKLPPDPQIAPVIYWSLGEMGRTKRAESGRVINQYTYGVAFMEMPFFLAAHAYEKIRGGPANGFSRPYHYALLLSAVCYTLLGLLLLYRTLKSFFEPAAALLSAVLLLLATNLLWFTLYQAGMAHVPAFFLFSALIYLTHVLHRGRRTGQYALAGFLCGLITVIRPVDIICLLIPLLYGVYDRRSLLAKAAMIRADIGKVALATCCFVVPLIPQLVYWKVLSGHGLYDSYGPEQTFDFLHPQVWKGLFSAANGWLVYTPVMFFALAGLLLFRRYRPLALSLWVILPVYVWVIYSWYVWNYINGFGSRPMIHMYPLLAFPLAAFIAWMLRRPPALRMVCWLLLALCTVYNVFFSIRQARGTLVSDYTNGAFLRQTLFRYHLRYSDLIVYDVGHRQPDADGLRLVHSFPCVRPADTLPGTVRDSAGELCYHITGAEEYPPFQIEVPYREEMGHIRWAACSGIFNAPDVIENIHSHMRLVFDVRRGNTIIHWEALRINNKIGMDDSQRLRLFRFKTGQWDKVRYYAKVPEDIREGDIMRMMIWNIGKNEMYVKSVCLELYD